ncbi:MAG: antitoxin family protein [Nitrospirae bacterium]|nr:antitoxin family protein [Nitrospirota bacterium]
MRMLIRAVYEHGILRPIEPLEGIAENTRVNITLEAEDVRGKSFARFFGVMSPDEADDIITLIEEEFEQVGQS